MKKHNFIFVLLVIAFVSYLAAFRTELAAAQTINERIEPVWHNSEQFTFQRKRPAGKSETLVVNASTGEMKIVDGKQRPASIEKLTGGQTFRSQSSSSDEVQLVFKNQREHAVDLYWVDASGGQKKYATLKAGETHRQPTFVGHAWLVQGSDGKFFGSVIASADDEVLNIEKEFARPQPSSRQRRQLENESPDRQYRMQWDVQRHDAKDVYLIESSAKDGYRTKLRTNGYRLPGDPLDQYQLVVTNTKTGEPIELELPVFEFGKPQTRWLNEHTLLIEKVDRGHQRFRLFSVNLETKETKVLIDEQSDHFLSTSYASPIRMLTYLKKTKEAIYSSERSGWRHLYLLDLTGEKPLQPITEGDWLVRKIEEIDEESRTLNVMIGGYYGDQDPYHQHLARVHFDGSELAVLTDGDGDHEVQFSPDGRFVIDTYSRVDLPPVHELRRASDGSRIVELMRAERLNQNSNRQSEGAVDRSLPTVFHAPGRDGPEAIDREIWGLIAFPVDYDPKSTKKYPVIESIYAGPHGSHVPKRYRSSPWHQEWTKAGFIVVQIDGMGTANRSKAFHNVCWQNLKDAGFPDRIAWMKAAAAKYPAMDLSRVGIFGVSAGGQNACGALIFHHDFYSAAVACCGCHDNRMDKLSWNEQWMGYPVGSHYAENSNIDHAHRLGGKLLLIVGELDENVPPASTLRLADALIKADKDFDFLMVPGAGHGDGGKYGRRKTLEFFQQHLMKLKE